MKLRPSLPVCFIFNAHIIFKAYLPFCFLLKQFQDKRKTPQNFFWSVFCSSRRLPIFTRRFQRTIFGTSELNFCVRNGNRWNLTVIDTGHSHGACHASLLLRMYPQNWISNCFLSKQSIWSRWGQALDLLVHASWTDHSAYTVCLSTL